MIKKPGFILLLIAVLIVVNNKKVNALEFKLTEADTAGNPAKVLHAEPVFNDFTTDLGGRKGDAQINTALGLSDMKNRFNMLSPQIEIEYAPLNRFGLEIQLPYSHYFENKILKSEKPDNGIEYIQWSAQYTFLVSKEKKLSLAFALRNQFGFKEPVFGGKQNSVESIYYSPFLIGAKNWNDKFFLSLMPEANITQKLDTSEVGFIPRLTTAFHYLFSGKENFIGIEFNKFIQESEFYMIARPQLTLNLSDKINLGTSVGIPLPDPTMDWNFFLRMNYKM